MTREILIGTGFALALIATAPRAAAAGIPDYSMSTVPTVIDVLGVDGAGAPDPAATFEVIIRDLANNPIAGADVWVDLANCADLRISQQSSGLVNPSLAGQLLDCPVRTIRGVTDPNGRVVFSVLGASINASGESAPGAGERCARYYVNGFLIGTATVHIYDQNGAAGGPADGVEISDLGRWLLDFGSGVYVGRSDYGSGSPGFLTIDDFSTWLRRFGLGKSGSGTGGAGFCP